MLVHTLNRVVIPTLMLVLAPAVVFALGDDPSSPEPLPPGVLMTSGILDGNEGRLDTLLGHYSGGFFSLLASDDNGSSFGGSGASGFFGLTLEIDDAIWLKMTGAGNPTFASSSTHTQLGQYQIYYDFYDSGGTFLEQIISPVDSLEPSALEVIHQPGPVGSGGGTVDVNINTLVGPGTGNAIDFWLFPDFTPGTEFQASITLGDFDTGLGLYDAVGGSLIDFDIDSGPGGLSLISGLVPASGELVIGVTGAADATLDGFLGEHEEMGSYTLQVHLIPEPGSFMLLALGLGSLLSLRRWLA